MELHRQSTPPAELLRASAAGGAPRPRREHADKLTVELQPGMAPIHVDPLRMTQAVTHLLNYALDAADGGRVHPARRRGRGGRQPRCSSSRSHHAGILAGEDERAHVFDGFRRVPGKGRPEPRAAAAQAASSSSTAAASTSPSPPRRRGPPAFRAVIPVGIAAKSRLRRAAYREFHSVAALPAVV